MEFNKHVEISSSVERMVLHGVSKLDKNETYDADTLICNSWYCSVLTFLSRPPSVHLNISKLMLILAEVHCLLLSLHD